jgi:parvulin-like peptidyl-prolyl isomerase
VINKSGADDTNALPLIREILGKIRDGASFTEMASIHSQGSQQQQGGDQGWERTAGLRQEFRDALATLKPGQTSEPIDTGDAINLLYVENVDAAHVRPLKDVAVDIEGILRGQEQTRLQKQWIAKLQKKTFVRYMR